MILIRATALAVIKHGYKLTQGAFSKPILSMKIILCLLLTIVACLAAVTQLKMEQRRAPSNYQIKASRLSKGSAPFTLQPFFQSLLVNITLGTPPQTLTVSLDLYDAEISVYNVACPNCTYTFDPGMSSTYKQYQRNQTCVGIDWVATDVFTIGGVVVPKQIFQQVILNDLGDIAWGGFLSLALGKTFDCYPSPLDNLKAVMDSPVFTIHTNVDFTVDEWKTGTLTLGGVDQDNCEGGAKIKYLPISAPNNWQIKMDGFYLGSYSLQIKDDVEVDTSIYEIWVAHEVFPHVLRVTGAKKDALSRQYVVDCHNATTLPPMIFVFGGQQFSIPASLYVTPPLKDIGGKCGLAVAPYNCENCPTWVIGTSFMTPYCGIFDAGNSRIGFSTAKQSSPLSRAQRIR